MCLLPDVPINFYFIIIIDVTLLEVLSIAIMIVIYVFYNMYYIIYYKPILILW